MALECFFVHPVMFYLKTDAEKNFLFKIFSPSNQAKLKIPLTKAIRKSPKDKTDK